MPLKLIRHDLTKMQVDVIVNTANKLPVFSCGTDSAVYHAAGVEELLRAREAIGELCEGDCAITDGFKLPCKYIIHAVSPLYVDGNHNEEEKLRSCYKKSLKLAVQYKCQSIAFPLIATGSFGYPKEEGLRIALDEIHAFLMHHDLMVYLVVFDEESTRLAKQLEKDLEAYIDSHYVEEMLLQEACFSNQLANYRKPRASGKRRRISNAKMMAECSVPSEIKAVDDCLYDDSQLKERMNHLSDTFQEYLMYLIQNKGLKNSDVYNRAILTKQLFSKIKLNPDYHLDKSTALRLCVGALLTLDETKDLLARAGYALSPCDKRDIIFSFFIERGIYDMIEIDIALEEHGLECFIQ